MRHLTQHQVSAAIDGALVGVSLQLVERHLEACEPCRLRSVRLNRTHEALMVLFRFEGGPALVESHGEESAPAAIPVVAISPAPIPVAMTPVAPDPPEPAPRVIPAIAIPTAPIPVALTPVPRIPAPLVLSEASPPVLDEDSALDDLDEMDAEAAEDAFAPIELASPQSHAELIQPAPIATPTLPATGIASSPTGPMMLRSAVVKPVEPGPPAADPPEPRPVVLGVGTGSGRRARRSRKRPSTARHDVGPSRLPQEPVAVPPVPAAASATEPPARDVALDPPADSPARVTVPEAAVVNAAVEERAAAPGRDAPRPARRPRDLAPQLVSAALGVLLLASVAGLIVLLGRQQRTGDAPPVEVRRAGAPAAESRPVPAVSGVPPSTSTSTAQPVVETPAPPEIAAPADSAPPAAAPTIAAPAVRKPPAQAAPAPLRAAMGLLCGEVTDEEGVPVAGARILLADMEVGVVTDRRGRFCVSAPRGDRTVSVVALGFTTYRLLVTMEGQTASLSIRLRSNSIPDGPGPR